jgi:flavin-binding protein dodecin
MADNTYKVIELIGTSPQGWEQAAHNAVTRAQQSLRELRVAEVSELDMTVGDNEAITYRAKLRVSFKFEGQ